MSSGVTMRNSKARSFLYGLVICAMCLTVYLLSRTHSQLKVVERSQDKCVQQRDSLSAQLQVVYEHKSRLEKSLQEEKASHKNFRLETQQKYNAIQNQLATEKRLAQEKLEYLTNEKQELEEKFDESEKKLNLLMNVVAQSKQNLSYMEEAKMKIQSGLSNQLQIIRQQKDEHIGKLEEIIRELKRNKEDLTQSNLNQAWKLQNQAEEIEHWKKNYKDLESQLQHASEQLQIIRAHIKDGEKIGHDNDNINADAALPVDNYDKEGAVKVVSRINEGAQDRKDKEDKVNLGGSQQNLTSKEDDKHFPENQLGDVAESKKLSFEIDNKERKIEPAEYKQANKLIKYPFPEVLKQNSVAYNSVGDHKVADNSMYVGNQPAYDVNDVLNKKNKAGDGVDNRIKNSEGEALSSFGYMPRAEQKLDNKPLDLPIQYANQGLVDQSLGLLGNSRNENIHNGIDHSLYQGAGKSGKMNFPLPNRPAEDIRDSKVISNSDVAILERPRVAGPEEQGNEVRDGQFDHNPLHFPQPRPQAENPNLPVEKLANGQHKDGGDRHQMEPPHLSPVNDLSHRYMFPLHPVDNNRVGSDYQFNVIPKPLPLKPQYQNLNFNENDLVSNHKPAPQMAENNAEYNGKLDGNLQEKAGMNRDHLFPAGDLSHRWRAGFGQNAGLLERPYNKDESQKENLKMPNVKQNPQRNKDGDHDYDYNEDGDDGDDQDLDGGNEDDHLIADNQNELGHGKVFQDADFDDQLQNNEDDEANQVPAGHDKNQDVGVMVVPR